jgi:hypothetical protein
MQRAASGRLIAIPAAPSNRKVARQSNRSASGTTISGATASATKMPAT